MKNRCIALVLAGGIGTRLAQLTTSIAKPAIPFGGRYRLIDFTLSNCCNSIIDTIGVLMPRKPFPLPKQIGRSDLCRSRLYSLVPANPETGYRGTANAVYENLRFIERFSPDYVLIVSGDHVYTMDYRPLLNYHFSKGADATIAVTQVPWSDISRFGIITVSPSGAIEKFIEKPSHSQSNLASMGIYLFSWPWLKHCLETDASDIHSSHDFGKDVIPAVLSRSQRLFAYPFSGYWRDVGTVEALYSSQMDLFKYPKLLNLQNPQWPVYSTGELTLTKRSTDCPADRNQNIGYTGVANIRQTVVFANVHISPKATVLDSVIMPGAYIGPESYVERAIIGPYAVLESGSVVRGGIAASPPVAVVKENLVISASLSASQY